MKYTMFVPLVGYLILFNESLVDYFELSAQFVSGSVFVHFPQAPQSDREFVSLATRYRLYALYFGGCALGVGQLFYSLGCPEKVKTYGSAAAFVSTEARIMMQTRFENMAKEIVDRVIAQSGLNASDYQVTWKKTRLSGPESPGITFVKPILATIQEPNPRIETDERLNAISRRFGEVFHSHCTVEQIMATWFVPLKTSRPLIRFWVSLFYLVGFVVLTIPTIDTFVAVIQGLF